MNQILLHKLHRWISLVFALPLAVVIVTGLILSFEPAVFTAKGPVAVTADNVTAALAQHDPDGKGRALFVRGYAGNISIMGSQPGVATHVDLATNTKIDDPGFVATLIGTSRRVHEKLILDMGWLVTASTAAMLVLIVFGVLMGLPRLRNSLSGWHKGTAWVLLPLVVLSPLTGLFMALGISFTGTPAIPAPKAPALPLAEAVRVIAAEHDLASVGWIRSRGNSQLVRLDDGGEMRVFTVGRDGLTPTARNWPRLIHEGNWGGWLSVLVNVVTSLAMVLLLGSGLWLWTRRQLRPRNARATRTVSA
jgi:uncharacterized iron-regulated membrane protein